VLPFPDGDTRVIDTAALRNQPDIETERLRLVQLGPRYFAEMWEDLHDAESRKLTGTTATFTPEQVRAHLGSLPGRDDRADFVVTRKADNVYLGEAVLNELDIENETMNFRIALNRNARNQGFGTEATRAVVEFGFDRVGLHRISLSVFAFNPRAQRVYEKVGFIEEGRLREALLWEGKRYDDILMALLAHERR
jgi:RimJ/RimL family protein N-acetyltransferase